MTNATIGFIGQVNTFILNATAGDVIRITTLGTSGGVCPDVEVSNPSGIVVGGFGCNDGISTLRLTNTGVHTVRVRDRDNDNTGTYFLSLVYATPKCAAIALSCGQVVTNRFTSSVQQDTYSISGVAGDVIRLTSFPLNGVGVAADMDLFNPAGVYLTTIGYSDGFSTFKLTNTGTYTLLVRDRDNDNTGTYFLSLVYATPKCAAIALSCGQVVTNTFTSSVQQHTYSISGYAGQAIRLISLGLSGGVCPDIDVFNQVGALVGTLGCSDAVSTLTLPSTQPYTAVVRERGNDNGGRYSLVLDAVGGCFQLQVGSIVGRTQEVTCIPLRTVSGSPATALNFTVQVPPGYLSNVTVNVGPRFTNASLTLTSNSQWIVRLRTVSDNPLIGDEMIGSICFVGVATQSVFLPLGLMNLSVTNLDGSVPGASAIVGRAVVIANQPLLEVGFGANRQRRVTTYGKATTAYEIRAATNVSASQPWALAMTNLVPATMFLSQPLTGSISNSPLIFLEANER